MLCLSIPRVSALRTACTIVAISTSAAAAGAAWTTYTPEGGGYTIDMPGPPKVTRQPIETSAGPIKTTIAGIEIEDKAYMSIYAVFPDTAFAGRSDETILDGSEAGAVKSSGGVLRKAEHIHLGPYAARRVVVDLSEGRVAIDLMVLKGNVEIQAIVVGDKAVETEPETLRFFASLKPAR